MIPKNIKRQHVLQAIRELQQVANFSARTSRKFLLECDGDHYPPKYVISLANKYVNDRELDPSEFSGGRESNDFLKRLGFNIVERRFAEKPAGKQLRKADRIPLQRKD